MKQALFGNHRLLHAWRSRMNRGSEFGAGAYRCKWRGWAKEAYMLLERQLVYTAVTRARQLVVLVGSKKALAIAVKNGPKHDSQEEMKAIAGHANPLTSGCANQTSERTLHGLSHPAAPIA